MSSLGGDCSDNAELGTAGKSTGGGVALVILVIIIIIGIIYLITIK